MKIKTKQVPYEVAVAAEKPQHLRPKKPSMLFRALVRVAASFDLHAVKFSYTQSRMDEAGDGPYLIFMNHSSFVDLEIASKILFPKPYVIVTTCDGFVGNAKVQAGLTAYDRKARQLGYYDDEDDFFEAMSDKYDENITSWGSFFKAKNKSDKETIEDLVEKYKITTEVTRTKDISVKKLLKENSRLIEGLEAKGLIDRDDISAAKEIVVKMKVKGEDQTVRNTYDMYLVKIGGAWKVLDYDVDSDYDD